MKAKITTLLFALMGVCVLTGCGKNEELDTFKEQMDSFCNTIVEIDGNMNSIDASSEDATEILLSNLDDLDVAFQELADYPVPDEFSYIETLADEASENMSEAVKLYHEAFSNDSYNEYTAGYAEEYYARAYKRVKYIITMLHGEMPDDENVVIISEDETNIDGEDE